MHFASDTVYHMLFYYQTPDTARQTYAHRHPTRDLCKEATKEKMVIVNPYLKKKKPVPSPSAGAGTQSTGKYGNNKGTIGSASRRPTTPFGSVSASNQNRSRPQPSHVTPNGKKAIVTNPSRVNVASKPHVSPPSNIPRGQKISSVTPNVKTAAAARPLSGKPSSVKRSSKSKLSVKQRLKQEIAALKKQKQLQKLQKEADERRRRRMAEKKAEEDRRMAYLAAKEEERRQKQAERERIVALKQEEKIQKQKERERKQREKELERERKREEKARKEEEKRLLLEQQMEERKKQAEEKYQRDLQAWKNHQQRWVEQQQRINLIQQGYQQRQAQLNYHIQSQQQMPYSRQIYQNHQQVLSNKMQFASPPPVSTPPPTQLPPKPEKTQELNEKLVSSDADSTPETAYQKTPSTPLSPLDSSTALALDTLMKSELFSSPTQSETDSGSDNEKASIALETEPSKVASTNGSNTDLDLCSNNTNLSVSDIDKESTPTVKLKDLISRETNSSLADINEKETSDTIGSLANIDKKEMPVTNRDSLATDNIQNDHSEPKNEARNHPVPDSATLSTQVAPRATVSTNTSVAKVSRQPDKELQTTLVPPSPMDFSQQKNSQQQHSRLAVPPSINNKFPLHSSAGYGRVYPNCRMPTPALTATPYLNPMINNGFMSAGNFSMPGYNSWVPPPPPPPLPPIFSQPKALRRISSVTKRPKAPKPSAPPLLCSPMEAPSPFANQGRYLVTVMVIRDPRTEPSFGVNLQLHTESALVDPEWLEAQKLKQAPKVKTDEKPTIRPEVQIKAEESTKHPSIDDGTAMSAAVHDKQSAVSSADPLTSQRVAKTNDLTMNASEDTSAIHDRNMIDVKVEVKDNKSEIDESRQKVGPPNTTNDRLSTPKSVDSVESDDNTKAIVKKCLEDLVSSVVEKTASATLKSVSDVQRRKRRRRVNFSVMQVMDAIKQNSRRPDVDAEKKLQPGDIVVAVQGNGLSGMTFKYACGVFSKKAESVSDSLIQTQVIVARKRTIVAPAKVTSAEKPNPEAPTSNVVPSPTESTAKAVTVAPQLPDNASMVFTPAEMATMSNSFFQTLHSSSRVLGLEIQDSAWHFHSVIFRMGLLLKETELTPRASITLKNKWSHLTGFTDYNLVEKGKTFWNQKLREEFGDEKIPFSTDVERHARRHLPRPSKGCRCGQKDHEYVFDAKCTLYRDLQKRLSKEDLAALRQQKKKKSSVSDKDLNKVESAFKNRMIKLKTATENESIEARFVEKMEEIQVKELHQAVFAPNLTTIVLSAIFELQREFYVSIEDDDEKANEDDDDDDDDDVALTCLGKRKSEDETENDAKKQHKIGREGDPNISLKYLIRMLEYVSKTWGHCYREPDRDDYAWRWELFHAVHSNYDQWDAHATNPRVSGSFTFENVRFGLSDSKTTSDEVSSLPKTIREFEDSIVSNSPLSFGVSNEILDQFCTVIHLLSPARTGIYDEIIALLKMGVFKISPSGIPVLTEDWWTKIDIVVLDDMHTSWSTKIDPDSRHCVNEELRDTLEEKWVKSSRGWSLLENRDELIFDFAILDEWRETFEGRLEEKANLLEGIGRFGL